MLIALLVCFLLSSSLLWLSVFAYPLVLVGLARRRRPTISLRGLSTLPEIAIIIPTLNEERLILRKLRDLRRSDYPRDRMKVFVVDGGSEDRTRALVEEESLRQESVRLVCVSGTRGQADQVDYALRPLTQEIAVVTDVDGCLDPSCIRELVMVLLDDPATAVVGANVEPDTNLCEERLHWRLVNYLWWLEGEALSSSAVSGVCYAIRRNALKQLTKEAGAEDILLTLNARAAGFRVRTCPTARATELRVPHTLMEFVRFRRRRGVAYAAALRGALKDSGFRGVCGLANLMRLWHFVVTPKLTITVVVLGFLLLWTSHLYWVLVVFGIFSLSVAAGLVCGMLPSERRRPWHVTLAFLRVLCLNLFSIMTFGNESLQTRR